MSTATVFKFFAVVAPGLEAWLAKELATLDITGRVVAGGVEARGDVRALWKVHLWSRLAESVRIRLRPFVARSFNGLEQGLRRLPWHAYFRSAENVKVSVSCHQSRLYHSDAVAERALAIINEKLRHHRNESRLVDSITPRLYLRLERNEVQTSVDASGDRLHRRGYRTHVGPAPLRETLAAAMVWIATEALRKGSSQGDAALTCLWDPFCGSGTIPIEAALFRARLPAGKDRRFGFESWPIHDARAYREWRTRELTSLDNVARRAAPAYGSDTSSKALAAAQHNATAAGVDDGCFWFRGDLQQAAARIPLGTTVVCNPPHGVRLSRHGLARLYTRFDQMLTARSDLRPVLIACGYRTYLRQTPLPWHPIAETQIGGLPVALLRLEG